MCIFFYFILQRKGLKVQIQFHLFVSRKQLVNNILYKKINPPITCFNKKVLKPLDIIFEERKNQKPKQTNKQKQNTSYTGQEQKRTQGLNYSFATFGEQVDEENVDSIFGATRLDAFVYKINF